MEGHGDLCEDSCQLMEAPRWLAVSVHIFERSNGLQNVASFSCRLFSIHNAPRGEVCR